jgi:hypothetical protein
MLRQELRRYVETEVGPDIDKLYAKLAIYYNMSLAEASIKHDKKEEIPIYFKIEGIPHLFNPPVFIDSKQPHTYQQACQAGVNELLKTFYENKLSFLATQFTETNLVKFLEELNTLLPYICLASIHPEVATAGKNLCENTISWLKKDIVGSNQENTQTYYNVLACLTLYAAVFDVMPCTSIKRILSMNKNPEKYELAMAKYAIKPPLLVKEFHDALLDQMKHKNKHHHFHHFHFIPHIIPHGTKPPTKHALEQEIETLTNVKLVLLTNVDEHQISTEESLLGHKM